MNVLDSPTSPGPLPPHSRPAPHGTPGRLGGRPRFFICQVRHLCQGRFSDIGSAALRIDRTVMAAGVKHEDRSSHHEPTRLHSILR
jgi:hypothetical protein